MKRFLFACIALSLIAISLHAQKIKVACVGNSVTYGYGLDRPEVNAYPAQLQRLLGDEFEVGNFGKSGATLLNKGHRPYMQQEEFKKAIAFAGDRVIIHLGLNDTDPRNWPNYRDEFVSDYLALIDSFRLVNPKCKIAICRMTPISNRHQRFESGTRDWYWQIQKSIEEIAEIANVSLIDLQEGLYNRPDLLPDALHPNIEGAGIIASKVYCALTGDYGGLQLSQLYSDNMVLQREEEIVLSGIANAGDVVTVTIGRQKKKAITASNGKWSVVLDPLHTGNPYTLTISTPKKKYVYNNVLAGEVWLCSGQSNMAFMVKEGAEKEEQLTKASSKPQIRFFDMKPRWLTNSEEWDVSALDSLNRLQYYKETKWQECTEQTAANVSAIAYEFGMMLSDSLHVPVGLIINAIGGSACESWIDRKTLEFSYPDILYTWKENDRIQPWVRERASLNVKQSSNKLQRHPYEPCYLFEAGIAPLAKYPVKGVIWYQGESNAHNIEVHEILFPLLVESWRKNWNKELPFYYVQLSSLNRPSWTWFRDSQRRMLKDIRCVGMAVSSDCGDSTNVHPTRKKEVGDRLARLALHDTYGKTLTPSGPLFRSVEFTNGAAFVTFDFNEGMHSSDGESLKTFEIAEHEGVFFAAMAEVVDGRIKVWSKEVKNPRFVRYGWQPFTRANLVNKEGLPASTFRTGY
ncbi:MAG: GDSL-type esterase/lipase family protein [Parabacteroides sp.]|nr:GDSL-type esterase/lipase family protein [Parabacteroides sp.]MDD4405105.1 GDSL-type esterase/lipase family protein [Parabacteroides sp.]